MRARHYAVALALLAALHHWPKPRERISSRYLAVATGRSRRLVREALAELVEAGVLESSEGRGRRPAAWRFRDPAGWGPWPARSGHPVPPTSEFSQSRPQVGTPSRPQVGTPSRPKVRERTERDSLPGVGAQGRPLVAWLTLELAAVFADYPHPRTGVIRSAVLGESRAREILVDEAGGNRSRLVHLLAEGIHGFVVRKGLSPHDSGWDPWPHFELASLASKPKLAVNLEAAAAARRMGHEPPFRRGDDTRTRPTHPREARPLENPELEALRLQVDGERAEREAETPAQRVARELALVEQLPDGNFKRERMRRVRRRAAELGAKAGS